MLVQQYGKDNVVKVAIGSFGADFLVLEKGRVVKVVEVKGTRKRAWYPSPREKEQLQRILRFSQTHNCKAELWIWALNGGRKGLRVEDVEEFCKR